MSKYVNQYWQTSNMNEKHLLEAAHRLTDACSPLKDYHSHYGYEIFQIWNKSGNVMIEDRIYPMAPGYIYIINAMDLHRTNPAPMEAYTRSKITVSQNLVTSLLALLDQTYLLDPFHNKSPRYSHCITPDPVMCKEMDTLFMKMSQENINIEVGQTAILWAYVIEMLTLVYRWYSKHPEMFPPASTPGHDHVQKVMSYITHHLQGSLTIDKIADELNLSKFHLCHLFKKITGVTVMEYVLEKRISKAKKKLLTTMDPISCIALDVGFNSFSIFSRAFKQSTGMTPSKYRQQHNIDSTAGTKNSTLTEP